MQIVKRALYLVLSIVLLLTAVSGCEKNNEFDGYSALLLCAVTVLAIALFVAKHREGKKLAALVYERTVELEAVISNYKGVIWSVDADGIIRIFNGQYLEKIGVTPDFLIGKNISTARLKNRHSDIIINIEKSIKEGPQEWIGEIDGGTFYSTTRVVYDKNDNVISVVGSTDDITDRVRMETMLNEALHEATAASRAKSEFLSHMSHEIRTPLNAIIGMINIGLDTDDIQRKDYCFSRADSASKHLLSLINDVLDMSKIEADQFELARSEIDFEKMLTSITNVTSVRAEEKNQNFVVNLYNSVPAFIEGDELRLSQVITNLLTNAIKFTPENGTITLSIEQMEESGDDVTLRIEVADNGIGIEKEQQEQIFNAFRQADAGITRKYGGTGLGLAISKRIVELMNGEIWVESEPNAGSVFVFTMKAKKLPKRSRVRLAHGVKTRDMRILAVDDSVETREYFLHVMDALKLNCDVAGSGADALDMIRNNTGKSYDIFFVDWQMPEMDGIELTRKIKEINGENSVVIMISVADWNIMRSEAIAAGVNHFVPKPLFPSALINAINICIGEEPEEENDNNKRDRPAKRSYDFSKHTILIAEDVEINREIMSAILEETNVLIDYAENGKICVSMFDAKPERYSLILMDINMPEMDGYEAARQIRAKNTEWSNNIPIIAMTANVFREDIEKCLESGMNDHTGKPVDAAALFGMMDKYFNNPGQARVIKNLYELERGVAWNDDLLTGNALVDMQHQSLFERVSKLVDLCEEGSDAEELNDTLEYLVNHTIRHFTDEEALQLEYKYPAYEVHKKQHDDFNATVKELVRRFEENGSSSELSSEVNKTLVRWLVNHIIDEDKKLSDFIRGSAVPGDG